MALWACSDTSPGTPEPEARASTEAPSATPSVEAPPPLPAPTARAPVPQPPTLPALDLIRAEWGKAENRRGCAPIAFSDIGGATGTPRRATFSAGWAVAWDQPGRRSAFGLAGPSIIAMDQAPARDQRARLAAQWPVFRELEQLPQPAFAGYGIEGAAPYPASNPEGTGLNSLAYVRVGGQTCTYNVWSRISRAHLEYLLEHLVVPEPAAFTRPGQP